MSVYVNGRVRKFRALLASSAALLLLVGCAALPISGFTGHEIIKEQRDPKTGLSYRLVEVTDFADLPPAPVAPPLPIDNQPIAPTDLIGPGDILNTAIYETAVPLFAVGGAAAAAMADTGAWAARMSPTSRRCGSTIRAISVSPI